MEKKEKNIKNEITQWIAAIVIIAVAAFVLRTFVLALLLCALLSVSAFAEE